MKQPAVYIMNNKKDGVLYTGVTSNLLKRVYEHKNSITKGFTHKYECKNLIFYERYDSMEYAITREKQIKAGSRKSKIVIIEKNNPDWIDLYPSII